MARMSSFAQRKIALPLPVESRVTILAGFQPGFVRVIGNVLPQILILLRAADEVFEGLLLPKLPLFVDA